MKRDLKTIVKELKELLNELETGILDSRKNAIAFDAHDLVKQYFSQPKTRKGTVPNLSVAAARDYLRSKGVVSLPTVKELDKAFYLAGYQKNAGGYDLLIK